MNYAMEIHDSYLKDFAVNDDGSGFLLFHACVYRSAGTLFQDAQESGWQNVRFLCTGMRIEGELLRDEYSLDGDITANGVKTSNIIYLPTDHHGEIVLQFNLHPDFEMRRVHATSMLSALEGDFKLEGYWDENNEFTNA